MKPSGLTLALMLITFFIIHIRREKSTPNFKKILVVKPREGFDGRDPITTKIMRPIGQLSSPLRFLPARTIGIPTLLIASGHFGPRAGAARFRTSRLMVIIIRITLKMSTPNFKKIYQGRYLWGRFGTFVRKCFTLVWTLASGCVPIAFVQNCIQSGEAFAFVYLVRL